MGFVAQVCILVSSNFAARVLVDRNDRKCCYGFVANPFVASLRISSASWRITRNGYWVRGYDVTQPQPRGRF